MNRFFNRLKLRIEYFDLKYPFTKYIVLLILFAFFLFGQSIINSVIKLVVLIFSVVIHEVAHGYTALVFGDNTAKNNKRLSLNPIRHIDLSSALLPLILILLNSPIIVGSATPVPINEYNMKPRKLGVFCVSVAGILANILLAASGFFVLKLDIIHTPIILLTIRYLIMINIFLAAFNILPIPPLDGSRVLKLLLPREGKKFLEYIEYNPLLSLIILIFVIRSGIVNDIGLFILRIIS